MVQRRERLKKQLLMVQSDRIQLEAKLLDAPDSREETSEDTRGSIVAAVAAVGPEVKTRSRSCSTSHLGSSSETDEEVTVRKTRLVAAIVAQHFCNTSKAQATRTSCQQLLTVYSICHAIIESECSEHCVVYSLEFLYVIVIT